MNATAVTGTLSKLLNSSSKAAGDLSSGLDTLRGRIGELQEAIQQTELVAVSKADALKRLDQWARRARGAGIGETPISSFTNPEGDGRRAGGGRGTADPHGRDCRAAGAAARRCLGAHRVGTRQRIGGVRSMGGSILRGLTPRAVGLTGAAATYMAGPAYSTSKVQDQQMQGAINPRSARLAMRDRRRSVVGRLSPGVGDRPAIISGPSTPSPLEGSGAARCISRCRILQLASVSFLVLSP